MTFTDLLTYNPDLARLLSDNSLLFVRTYNAAYHHVRERLALYPKYFKCTFTLGVNLNDPIALDNGGGQIQFKEITEVLGQTLLNEPPHNYLDKTAVANVESFLTELDPKLATTGLSVGCPIFFSHNYVYVDSEDVVSLPMVGHLYPPAAFMSSYDAGKPLPDMPMVELPPMPSPRIHNFSIALGFVDYSIPDILVFPLTAKMYALIALESDNVNMSNAYDSLCNHYINMRNSSLTASVPKSMSQTTVVTPYALL